MDTVFQWKGKYLELHPIEPSGSKPLHSKLLEEDNTTPLHTAIHYFQSLYLSKADSFAGAQLFVDLPSCELQRALLKLILATWQVLTITSTSISYYITFGIPLPITVLIVHPSLLPLYTYHHTFILPNLCVLSRARTVANIIISSITCMMSWPTKRPAAQVPAEASSGAPSSTLDIYDRENWGDAFKSDWAKKERLWSDKAETQGYGRFKEPEALGYMSDFDAGSRYRPTLNKKGEWVLNDAPPIHRSTYAPSKRPRPRPVSPPRAGVAAEDRAAFNQELREQAAQYGEPAPKGLPEPMERRNRLLKKRAAAAAIPSEPTRKSARVRDQPARANAPAPIPTTAVGVTESSASALVPKSENTMTSGGSSSSMSTIRAAMAPIGTMVSTGPSSTSTDAPAAPVSMQMSNDNVPDNQPENSVAPVAFLQGSCSSVSQTEATSQGLRVTWKMHAALARNVQSIMSTITSIKQEEGDGKSNKAVTGRKRRAEDDEDRRPAKKAALGKIVHDKKRKAKDESGPSKKRTRISHACQGCQHWRVKCDGASPCSSCVKRGKTCVYDKNDGAKDDDFEADGVSETESDLKPPRSLAGPVSTKNASLTRGPAAVSSKKSAVGRAARGPSCNMCREKKTGCSREKPCSNCKERGWNCVYEVPQTTDQPKNTSSGGGSGSGAPGKKPSGGEQKNSGAEATLSHQLGGPSNGSSAQQTNGAAENTKVLSELQITQNESSDIRSILPAISKWTVKGDYGFQDLQFNITACLTKRQLEKREMVPEEDKQDFGILETATNEQRTQEESFHSRPSIKLVLPDHLKGFLVDDWENVTKNGLVVELPHSKATVDQILKDYVEYEKQHRQEGSAHMDILVETIEGLREYFDKALARILLYR